MTVDKTTPRSTNDGGAAIQREADFSADRRCRYSLRRSWGNGPHWLMVMLNPSIADETRDDPTTTFCMRQAMRRGYGSYEAVNLYALVATDPAALRTASWLRVTGGEQANRALRYAIRQADLIVCAWGDYRGRDTHQWRVRVVRGMLPDTVHVFGFTKHGFPRFPRALRRDVELQEWKIR